MHTDQWVPDFDDPDDLTPEERLAHIVRILALGSIRLVEEQQGLTTTELNGVHHHNGFEH